MIGLTFQKLVELFLNGGVSGISGGSGNLKIKANQLIHYNTVIAERFEGKILINVSRYSLTTGILQKQLRDTVPAEKSIEVRNVPRNYQGSLSTLINNQPTHQAALKFAHN